MFNPFAKPKKPKDTTPAPGGVAGQYVDFIRWYPPDTPYQWGERFQSAFGGNYFSQWPFAPVPPSSYFQDITLFPSIQQQDFPGTLLWGATLQYPLTVDSANNMESSSKAVAQNSGSPVAFANAFNKVDN